jgi:ABC-type uncharacterized transport system permease subunit
MGLIQIASLGTLAYLAAALLLARSLASEGRSFGGMVRLLATVAVATHFVFHGIALHQAGGLDVHFFAALSEVSLVMALIELALAGMNPMRALGLVIFPVAAACLMLDGWLGTPTPTPTAQGWQITLHVVLALFAFALLSIAALVAVMLAIQERALRNREFGGIASWLPALSVTEALLFQLIATGFALLTLALATGAMFVEDLLGQHLAHKTVFSILAWFVFGALLYGRWRHGWRGQRAARLALMGMAALAIAFLGSKFVLELVLHRVT